MSRQVTVGNVKIGGGAPVSVQSMLNVPAHDFEGNLQQARALYAAGCEMIRVSVPDKETVPLVSALREAVPVPIVADIHFDYRLAVAAAEAGAQKIRINPGNIGGDDKVKAVADCCRQRGIPIRVGVNAGSLSKEILRRYGSPTPEALVESAFEHIRLLNRYDFDEIVVSIKSSDVPTMYAAYTLMAERSDYPLHLGVTEAGTERSGLIKSAAGIGGLLLRGIGDTIRVSLTADPVREVIAGIEILRAVGLRRDGVTIASCPTCGRTKIDIIGIAEEVERRIREREPFWKNRDFKVAVMGCVVNGPGEAKEADIGIAGGDHCGVLIRHGEVLRTIPEERLVEELMAEIEHMQAEETV